MNEQKPETAVQGLFDVANAVLDAALTHQQSAGDALQSLEQMRRRIEDRLERTSQQIAGDIKASASDTATRAAELISAKFTIADQAAKDATHRYEAAARFFGWKWVASAAVLQVTIVLAVWWLESRVLPSDAEIEAKRSQIAQLQETIASLHADEAHLGKQVGEMKRKVTDLERRGGALVFTECPDDSKQSHLCFETDERAYPAPWTESQRTFRVPVGF